MGLSLGFSGTPHPSYPLALNNIVEQDHRAVKRLVRPMLGFKSFRSAHVTLTGIELMHMIRKGQLRTKGK
jgi:putative transposase